VSYGKIKQANGRHMLLAIVVIFGIIVGVRACQGREIVAGCRETSKTTAEFNECVETAKQKETDEAHAKAAKKGGRSD
jgi:nitrogen fixation protein FixH